MAKGNMLNAHDEEVEEEEEEVREVQKMGKNGYALKRQQLQLDYSMYIPQQQVARNSMEIYLSVMGDITLKGRRRLAMMATCAYEAYKKNGIWKDPILLAKSFKVDKSKLKDAQDLFRRRLFDLKKLNEFPKQHLSAQQVLPDIASHFNIKNVPFEELNEIISQIYSNTVFLNRWAPRDVAIGTLFWYVSNLDVDNSSFTKDKVKTEAVIAESKINLVVSTINSFVGSE